MQTKTKAEYIEAWNDHIASLAQLLGESLIPYSEWDIILLPLRNCVTSTADRLDAQGLWGPVYRADPIFGYIDGYIASSQPPFAVYTDRGDQPKGNLANVNWWFQIGDEFFNVHPKTTIRKQGQPQFIDEGYPVRWIQTADPRIS